ncbi:hypothetical protein K3H43_01440 [Aeromonas veronii]|uniref:hypothetical protein n=1 Tax=Aeromonas veronii TaxID=654 RepID=UPI001F45AA66|nr:hypothetical protein [Aeromonas veronii]MCF5726053.1 hypothetical protein [Aeromonas veronii]
MKKSIILLCAALLGGCIEHAQSDTDQPKEQQVSKLSNDDRIRVWHDDQRHVTCWVYLGYKRGGLSCIPDDQLPVGGK